MAGTVPERLPRNYDHSRLNLGFNLERIDSRLNLGFNLPQKNKFKCFSPLNPRSDRTPRAALLRWLDRFHLDINVLAYRESAIWGLWRELSHHSRPTTKQIWSMFVLRARERSIFRKRQQQSG